MFEFLGRIAGFGDVWSFHVKQFHGPEGSVDTVRGNLCETLFEVAGMYGDITGCDF